MLWFRSSILEETTFVAPRSFWSDRLVPAAVCYFRVLRCRALVDRWRVKHGHDVYQQRAYEDNAGFIHLNAVPECEKQEVVGIGELVSGMEPLLDDSRNDSDD